MQQFIPFEDDWDALESLDPSALIPFRIDLARTHAAPAPGTRLQRAPARSASIASTSPTCAPMRLAVPAGSSST